MVSKKGKVITTEWVELPDGSYKYCGIQWGGCKYDCPSQIPTQSKAGPEKSVELNEILNFRATSCDTEPSVLRLFRCQRHPDSMNVPWICRTDIESDVAVKTSVAVCECHGALWEAPGEIIHTWSHTQHHNLSHTHTPLYSYTNITVLSYMHSHTLSQKAS